MLLVIPLRFGKGKGFFEVVKGFEDFDLIVAHESYSMGFERLSSYFLLVIPRIAMVTRNSKAPPT